MLDLLADVDPSDVHFRLTRLPSPPSFDANDVQIAYTVGQVVREGPGSIHADLNGVAGAMEYDEPLKTGEIRTLGGGAAGKLIGPEQYGTLRGIAPDGEWIGTGAYIVRRFGDPFRPSVEFRLDAVTRKGASVEPAAFTREILYGARLEFLATCLATPISSRELRWDRVEEVAFGKRLTLRDLRESPKDSICATAVVYDGPPFNGAERQAVWLAVSLLAGAVLHPAVVETYDAAGELIERVYRPGVPHGTRGDAPFHPHYASYPEGSFATLCERIAELLRADFPIDVVIAHLHDANEGSMERRMQSCLLAIHTASEAWNRLHERTVIVDGTLWKWLKRWVAAAARGVADAFDLALGESVGNSVLNANNTSTGARLRLFLKRMGLGYSGATKKAIELRNSLFHEGYLQRRFSSLEREQRQNRYDDLQRLREFTMRMVFALCDMDVCVHGLLNAYGAVASRDLTPERDLP